VAARGLVFDCGSGDLLKLDGDGFVCAARHGLRAASLPAATLRARYGRTPWRHFSALLAGTNGGRGGADYRVCDESFVSPAALLYARLVDVHDARGAPRRGRYSQYASPHHLVFYTPYSR
jgi:hypothetical protein